MTGVDQSALLAAKAPSSDAQFANNAAVLDRVSAIARTELAPLATAIDQEAHYPAAILRALGAAGAYGSHLPDPVTGAADLRTAISAMSLASEHCLSTSFCMWCQSALAWYIAASDNEALKQQLLSAVASGAMLGGTGLSNPVKALTGVERFKLKGRKVDGGYVVKGALPWVSNLEADHVFATAFEVEDSHSHHVMAIIGCSDPGVKLIEAATFVALDATRTFSVQLRDVFVPDVNVLGNPAADYIERIRAGFILLQAGMGLGLIRDCVGLMRQERTSLGHVNKYIERQPEGIEAALVAAEAEVLHLASTPFDPEPGYFQRVLEARLRLGELSVEAAHFAMLHQGAKGYVKSGIAQRRLREAYFVAIVTPATKHLRKMLADGGGTPTCNV
ncbi:MAG: acyl-CoA dehydrogenase family protein [Hyphomicrobium sp.]